MIGMIILALCSGLLTVFGVLMIYLSLNGPRCKDDLIVTVIGILVALLGIAGTISVAMLPRNKTILKFETKNRIITVESKQ